MSKVFVDQIPPEGGRKYILTANTDGTVGISDVTEYVQEGTAWGAADANATMRKEDYDPNNDGVIGIPHGGTGSTTAAGARSALGITPASIGAAPITRTINTKPLTDDITLTFSDIPGTLPASVITDLPTGKKVARFVIGTSTAGWTSADCDYLCDGTADQAEINAAITALPATGGEIVILDGTYNITAKIDVTKDNVSIKGNGNATILKRMFNSSVKEGVITLTGRSGCKIANLQIDGNKASYSHNNNYGIALYNSSNNTITGNTCNNGNHGIRLELSSNNTITGNTCNNASSYGIYLFHSGNNTVTGNTCDNNGSGISVSDASNNTVTGNTCDNNGSGISVSDASNNTVTGNTCSNSSYGAGISLRRSSNNTITGNTCIRGTGLTTDYTSLQHTIQLNDAGNSYNLISNNNCMGKAVTNEGGTGNTLVNNKFNAT